MKEVSVILVIDTGKFSSALVTNIGTDTAGGIWKADIDLKVEGLSDIYLESGDNYRT